MPAPCISVLRPWHAESNSALPQSLRLPSSPAPNQLQEGCCQREARQRPTAPGSHHICLFTKAFISPGGRSPSGRILYAQGLKQHEKQNPAIDLFERNVKIACHCSMLFSQASP